MDIGKILAQLDKRMTALENSARLSHASLDATALEVRDAAGSLRGIIGQQPDGTTSVNIVNGPTPPVPSAPTVTAELGALSIAWDGLFTGAVAAPLDWMRVEVHVGPDAAFTPTQGTLRGTIESPQGGTVLVALPYTEWWVKLRSRTTSGVASNATTGLAATPRKADAPDLAAGAVTADSLAADAITGKTITGGEINGSTITGAYFQTAATGQRVTINEAGLNQIIVREASGNAIAELSARGLLVEGTSGALITIDPSASLPAMRWYTPSGTSSAVMQLIPDLSGTAAFEAVSGRFSGDGYTDMVWRTLMSPDLYVVERKRGTGDDTTSRGGFIELRSDYANLGYFDASGTTESGFLNFTPGAAAARGRLAVRPFAPSANNVLSVEPPAGHTGNAISVRHAETATSTFSVTRQGLMTAANIVTGTTTITPSAAHTATSASVTYPTLPGTTFRAYATANTTVPGVRTPLGAFYGVTGVSVSSVTANGMLVWVNRENTTATVINWMVISS